MATNKCAAVAVILTSVVLQTGAVRPQAAGPSAPRRATPCQPAGTATIEHSYTVAARVRPLLFWIGRDNVGGARIIQSRGSSDPARFELLIGSDPELAPRRINRWGYLAETVCGGTVDQLGVMTESNEKTIEEAEAQQRVPPASREQYRFQAIRSQVVNGYANAATHRISVAANLTFRDVQTLVARVPAQGGSVRQVQVPEGTAPGFLVAVASLLHDAVDNYRRSGRPQHGLRRPYVYHGEFYDLTLRSSQVLAEVQVGGETYRSALESDFENKSRKTGKVTTFRIVYGTSDPIREVPLRVVYRPRWWFEAELQIQAPKGMIQADARGDR